MLATVSLRTSPSGCQHQHCSCRSLCGAFSSIRRAGTARYPSAAPVVPISESCAEWPRAASVKRDHQAIVSINCHLSRVKPYAGSVLATRSTLFRIHRPRFHLQASTQIIPLVEIFTSSGFAWVTFLVHGPRPPGNASSYCELLPYVR
jgi:hypothetical protein